MSTLDFGSYVKELRKSCGLGLRVAAVQLGINPSYLSRIETGAVPPPSAKVIADMAVLYKVSVPDLASRMDGKRTDVSSLDPVAAALYRIAMSAPASDRIKMLQKAVDELPPDKKEWWQNELDRLSEELRLTGGSGLLREWKGTNDLYDQYAIPRRLRAGTIEEMAQSKLRAFFGKLEAYTPPTPIEALIESVEKHIDFATYGAEVGGSFEDGTPRVLGRCRWKFDGRIEIGIDERLLDAQKGSPAFRRGNFTLGHEYFHAIEHLPRLRRFASSSAIRSAAGALNFEPKGRRRVLESNEDWREYQANVFAAAILMPAHAVRELFHAKFGEQPITARAKDLSNVSTEVAQWSNSPGEALTDAFDVNPQAMAIRLQSLELVIAEDE